MIPIVLVVAYLLTIGGFLYLLAAVLGDSREERDQLSAYYAELLLQTEIQAQNERNVLLERIQRPDLIPANPLNSEPVISDEIHDDLHLVGSIKDDNNPPPPDAA
jgi:hypothetical protein